MPEFQSGTILLIEDDAGHARLIERNLRRADVANPITVFHDGHAALDYLFKERFEGGRKARLPLLILLDLNLPGLNGYQILEAIKGQSSTRHIPVVILTTSDSPDEIEKCYALGCNIYLTKPIEYDQFVEAIRRLGLLLAVVKIPNGA